MELVAVLLYTAIGGLVWRLSHGWIRDDFRVVAAVFWPFTLLTWVAAGLLLVPACLLAFAGYLNTCWHERRPRTLSLP